MENFNFNFKDVVDLLLYFPPIHTWLLFIHDYIQCIAGNVELAFNHFEISNITGALLITSYHFYALAYKIKNAFFKSNLSLKDK